jgi:hypothetical protein
LKRPGKRPAKRDVDHVVVMGKEEFEHPAKITGRRLRRPRRHRARAHRGKKLGGGKRDAVHEIAAADRKPLRHEADLQPFHRLAGHVGPGVRDDGHPLPAARVVEG